MCPCVCLCVGFRSRNVWAQQVSNLRDCNSIVNKSFKFHILKYVLWMFLQKFYKIKQQQHEIVITISYRVFNAPCIDQLNDEIAGACLPVFSLSLIIWKTAIVSHELGHVTGFVSNQSCCWRIRRKTSKREIANGKRQQFTEKLFLLLPRKKTVLLRSSFPDVIWQCTVLYLRVRRLVLICRVGCVAQLAQRRSLAGELTLSCARPAVDGCPLCG